MSQAKLATAQTLSPAAPMFMFRLVSLSAPDSLPADAPSRKESECPNIAFSPGQTIAQAVFLSGLLPPVALCSGLSRCGRCRMRVQPAPPPQEADRAFFTPQELAENWRLGCRHPARADLLVEVPEPRAHSDTFAPASPSGLPAPGSHAPSVRAKTETGSAQSFLAIDLGTTSLHWRLETAGHVLEGQEINPQAGAGCDVMSRIAAALAPQGAQRLHELAQGAVRRILSEGTRAASQLEGGNSAPVSSLCLAANPAMTALFLGLDVHGLAAAPYTLPLPGGSWETPEGLPPTWIPPQIAPFIGGDTSAGYAALALGPVPAPYPFLLADMGTNGEFLLALSPDETLAASVALGPALEGTSLRYGCEARPGAVTSFTLTPQGLSALMEAGSGPACGICGTGYISLLSCMKQAGALSPDGRFTAPKTPLARRFFTPQPDENGENSIALPHNFRLHAGDVEEILKTKAAFSLGMACLVEEAGLQAKDLAAVFLAGALGSHMDVNALANLGFVSPGLAPKIQSAGNTALNGASLLARCEKTRDSLISRMRCVRTLDLASHTPFTSRYIAHMQFA